MSQQQPQTSPVRQRTLTRRAFLPWLIVAVFGLGLFLLRKFIWGRAYPPLPQYAWMAPRFLRSEPSEPLHVEEGFYLNPETKIIHYLPEGKRRVFTGRLNAKQLLNENPIKLKTDFSAPTILRPRVNLSRASYSFERAAVSEFNRHNLDRGCALLLQAIQYELKSVNRIGKSFSMRPFHQSPSFRLYDLMAGVSVRYNRADDFRRMIDLITTSKDPNIIQRFDSRLKKWQDPQSRWHSRWTDRSKQIKWTVDEFSGLVLLM